MHARLLAFSWLHSHPTWNNLDVCLQVAHEASWRFLLLHGKFTTK